VTPTSRTRSTTATKPGDAAGLQDLTRSVRVLARSSRDLITDAGGVLERELAMVVEVSERLRDQTVSEELLREGREVRVLSGLRRSAHSFVDLAADAVGVATVSAVRFGEAMVDQPRQEPAAASADTTAAASA
jgi:hypothetical protein